MAEDLIMLPNHHRFSVAFREPSQCPVLALLRPGGVLLRDDYHLEDPGAALGVKRAFHDFFAAAAFYNLWGKCVVRKPDAPS